jgi:hypothetical protein
MGLVDSQGNTPTTSTDSKINTTTTDDEGSKAANPETQTMDADKMKKDGAQVEHVVNKVTLAMLALAVTLMVTHL